MVFAALDTERCWAVSVIQQTDYLDQMIPAYTFAKHGTLADQLERPVAVLVQLKEDHTTTLDRDQLEALLGCTYLQESIFATEKLLKNYPLWGYGEPEHS